MSNKSINLTPALYDYLLAVSLREPAVLARLREETSLLPVANMQISPDQGQFMRMLIHITGARRIIEIGTFTGYSAISMALGLPSDGRLLACDVSTEWTDIARRYFAEAGVAKRIELRIAPAMSTLDALLAAGEAGRFDFAFIDADKPSYDGYVERALRLVRPGGLIAIDNVLWSGRVADPAVDDGSTLAIRALNAKLATDERVEVAMVPIGDGLTLLRVRPT